jgi:hypothetical protein
VETTYSVAGRILTDRFGGPLSVRPLRTWDGVKSTVVRWRVGPPLGCAPGSVIVKRSKTGAILEDWAASLFLERIPHDPPLAPRCYGGDTASQTIVLEDLGDGDGPDTLAALEGDDPEAATAALVEHLRLMGLLHAATIGRHEEYTRIRLALGPSDTPMPLYHYPWSVARRFAPAADQVEQAAREYRDNLASVGLATARSAPEEIERVTAAVECDPGPFLAFCQGDVNEPVSCLRRGGRLRLYDFDSGGFRHALIEGLAGRLTWGSASRIPEEAVRAMEAAYRGALAGGCEAARDDRLYREAVVLAAARWHIFHVIWRLPTALDRDYQRGRTRLRQQFLAWLDAFVRVVEGDGSMPALEGSARALSARLGTLWAEGTEPLPCYPAFCR